MQEEGRLQEVFKTRKGMEKLKQTLMDIRGRILWLAQTHSVLINQVCLL